MPKRERSQLSKHTSQAGTAKMSRIRESSIENENRLASQREYASQSRARESSTEHSQRLDDQNARTSHGRARESDAERSLRLIEQNARTLQLYASQNETERLQRLISQRERKTASINVHLIVATIITGPAGIRTNCSHTANNDTNRFTNIF